MSRYEATQKPTIKALPSTQAPMKSSSIRVTSSRLPDAIMLEMNFLESSFFQNSRPNRSLPTPAEVRALSPTYRTHPKPTPVRFEELNLLVKFGPYVTTTEAQCLWMIRKELQGKIPVPEIYGWRIDGADTFIYMQLIQGDTLRDRWDSLSNSDKMAVCHQLRQITMSLCQLEQDPDQSFIGSVSGDTVLDIVFEGMPTAGRFTNIKLFNDWISWLALGRLSNSLNYEDPYRPYLSDTGNIKFTHGDLHRGNIIISPTSPPRILGLVDWGQSGWYPDYWEYCKACYTSGYGEEWREQWIPEFLSPRAQEFEVFAEYAMAMGSL